MEIELIPILACNPMLLMVASLAISAASGAAQFSAQKQAAKKQEQYQRDVSKELTKQEAADLTDKVNSDLEAKLATAAEQEKLQNKAMLARSKAQASADASGLTGHSIDALMQEYYGQEAQLSHALTLGDHTATARMQRALDRSAANFRGKQVSTFRPVNHPSPAAYALKTGASMLGGVSTYYSGGFGDIKGS